MVTDNAVPWSEEDIQYLKDNWRLFSASRIGQKLGRSRNSVIGKASRLKLARKTTAPFAIKRPVSLRAEVLGSIMTETVEKPGEGGPNEITLRKTRKRERKKKLLPDDAPAINAFAPKKIMKLISEEPIVSEGLTIDKLRDASCRFITGKNDQGSTVFCGVPAHKGSWCKEHYDRVYDFGLRYRWR